MKRFTLFILGVFAMTAPLQAAEKEPVEVMVLGTYHFANPGLDLVNSRTDDVTTKQRQEELEQLQKALATFKPDRVLIEKQIHNDSFAVSEYETYTPASLATERNENFQIGYRLAHSLGHQAVYGYDEQPKDGEPDYFPMGKVQTFAKENDRMGELGALIGSVQARAKEFEASQKCKSIPDLLLAENDMDQVTYWHKKLYYGLLDYGDRDNQAGAELNSYWYMRNAKMMAKIDLITEPGERIFVLVGAGHKYWLEHFVANTPGYVSVDPRPYLKQAAESLPAKPDC